TPRGGARGGAAAGGGPARAARAAAADHAADGTSPSSDLNATAEFRQHLARVLTKRALTTAAG
ncbi:MAG: hypothetical protein JJT89_08530, partial [Nitriliruptoraceae bacterium]|nr:hypothetical protein [Nitriliruptoraceae bacterium]